MITALLLACAPQAPAPPPVQVEAVLASAQVESGQPIALELKIWTAPGWKVETGPLLAEGLRAEERPPRGPVEDGGRQLLIRPYVLQGPDGSYVIDPSPVMATAPDGSQTPFDPLPVFVDLGVKGPAAQLQDYASAPPPAGPPWLALGLGAAALAAVAVGIWRWRRPPPKIPALPDPADVVALRAWETARAQGLDDHALALALSQILRQYLQDVTGWPATARTSREVLEHLGEAELLGVADRVRAGRVLDATDRLKFAREGGGADFFVELDGDFRAVVAAMRPRSAP